ncbi:cation transporter [Nonomuraea aridisoli]|uniref:cation transporter n=1 Tax=Nonomuraea aridisoli TaxID=2070368 RepID=UPI001F18D558|nr:cation transporter [Nonomuraea aridisoli]
MALLGDTLHNFADALTALPLAIAFWVGRRAATPRLMDPQDVRALWWVAAAGVIGFAGNEWVARYRIKVGREIGSAALVADGLHARADGFTALAVLLGAGGAALGFPIAASATPPASGTWARYGRAGSATPCTPRSTSWSAMTRP